MERGLSRYVFLTIGVGIGIAVGITIGFGALNSMTLDLQTRLDKAQEDISTLILQLNTKGKEPSGIIGERYYIYAFGKESVSIIDPLNNNIILQSDVPYTVWPANHYLDQNGLLWTRDMADKSNTKVIDPRTLKLIENIHVGGVINPVEVTPDGKLVFIPASSHNEVWVVDIESFEVLKKIPVGLFPCDVDFTPDGELLYVPNRDSDTVSVISVPQLQVIETIDFPEGDAPFMLTVSHDGKYVFVENYGKRSDGTDLGGGKSESIIDVSTNKIIKTVDLGGRPGVSEPTPDGKFTYIGVQDIGSVAVLDISKLEIVKHIPVGKGPKGLLVGADGKHVYVPNSKEDTLSVIEIATNKVIKTLKVGEGPIAVTQVESQFLQIVNSELIEMTDSAMDMTDPSVEPVVSYDNTVISGKITPRQTVHKSITLDHPGLFILEGQFAIEFHGPSEVKYWIEAPSGHITHESPSISSILLKVDNYDSDSMAVLMGNSQPISQDISGRLVFIDHAAVFDLQQLDLQNSVVLAEIREESNEDVSLIQKESNVANKGASALIVYNNEPGIFFGHLKGDSDHESRIPVVSVTREDASLLRQLAEDDTTVTLAPTSSYAANLTVPIEEFKTVNLEIGDYKVWFHNEGPGNAEVTLNYSSYVEEIRCGIT